MSSKRTKKRIVRELVCARCDTNLDGNQLYCYECGEPTSLLKNKLSAFNTITKVWSDYKNRKGLNYGFAIFYIFVLLLPLAAIIVFTRENYYIHNLILLVFLPLLFIPFSIKVSENGSSFTVGKYFGRLKEYPRYFVFILVNILYFFLLKLITTSVDPILNLVRLVMVLYWLAIVVPLPHLISWKKINAFKGLLMVYKYGKETRWQQFFIYFILTIINILGLALIGIGLLVTIPFSITVMEEYYRTMDSHKLFGVDKTA